MLKPAGADIPFNSNVDETGFVSVLRLANGAANILWTIDAKALYTEAGC